MNIKVMHHTEYIDMLIQEGQLKVNALDLKTVFHNPCELGRGCGVVDAPESVLKQVSRKIPTAYDFRYRLGIEFLLYSVSDHCFHICRERQHASGHRCVDTEYNVCLHCILSI